MMSTAAFARYPTEDQPELRPELTCESREIRGMVDHMKEEFGDYSDPLTYDWTWRETD
jgi:hypothetical protein